MQQSPSASILPLPFSELYVKRESNHHEAVLLSNDNNNNSNHISSIEQRNNPSPNNTATSNNFPPILPHPQPVNTISNHNHQQHQYTTTTIMDHGPMLLNNSQAYHTTPPLFNPVPVTEKQQQTTSKKRKQSSTSSTISVNNMNETNNGDSPKKKKKRKQVKRACINCHKSHAGCDEVRPCKRCVSLGLEASCLDVEPRNTKRKNTTSETKSESNNSGSAVTSTTCPPSSANLLSNSHLHQHSNSNTPQSAKLPPPISTLGAASLILSAPNHQYGHHHYGSSHYATSNGASSSYLHHPMYPPSGPLMASPSLSQNSGGSGGSYQQYSQSYQRQLLPPPSSLINSMDYDSTHTSAAGQRVGQAPINAHSHLALINSVMMQQQLLIQALQKLESGSTLDPNLTNSLIAGNNMIGQTLDTMPNKSQALPNLAEKTPPSTLDPHHDHHRSSNYFLPPSSSLSSPSPNLLPSVNSNLLSPGINNGSTPMNRTYSSSSLEGLLGPVTPTAATPLSHVATTPLHLHPEVGPITPMQEASLALSSQTSSHRNLEVTHSHQQKENQRKEKENITVEEKKPEQQDQAEEDEYVVSLFRKPNDDLDIIDNYFALFNSNISDDGYEEYNIQTDVPNETTTEKPTSEDVIDQSHFNTCIISKDNINDPSHCSGSVFLPAGEVCVAVWKLNGVLFSGNRNFFSIFGAPSLSEGNQINFSSILDMDSDPDLKQLFSCRSDFYAKKAKLHRYVDKKEQPADVIEGFLQAYVIRDAQGILPIYITTHISVAK